MTEPGPLTHSFICEGCGDSVLMSWHEYVKRQNLVKNTRKNPLLNGARIRCADCQQAESRRRGAIAGANSKKKKEMRPSEFPPKQGMNLRPTERDDYGVTATIREKETGEMMTVAASGPVAKALGLICDMLDARGGNWLIVTISTPATIFADLQGYRNWGQAAPEATLLGRLGRRDLLEERR